MSKLQWFTEVQARFSHDNRPTYENFHRSIHFFLESWRLRLAVTVWLTKSKRAQISSDSVNGQIVMLKYFFV